MEKKNARRPEVKAKGCDYPGNSPQGQASVYSAAKAYLRAGLSFIPIGGDGTKRPAFELLPSVWCETSERYRRPWSGFKEQLPTHADVRAWYENVLEGKPYGIAIIAGAVSGGLEIIDIDNWQTVEPWQALVEKRAPGLLNRVVRVKSPRPGMHLHFRSSEAGPSQKLARVPLNDPDTGKLKAKAVIELKGEAGYCLAPPSPGACHPSGRP